ncbi:macrolide ABC transporter ATP-binding protein, partial [Candidatus Woesebacteria bacterium CG_4_10_14_0_2_um_filter_39_14]
IFEYLNKAGNTVILVTHEKDIAEHAKKIIKLHDGQIIGNI